MLAALHTAGVVLLALAGFLFFAAVACALGVVVSSALLAV